MNARKKPDNPTNGSHKGPGFRENRSNPTGRVRCHKCAEYMLIAEYVGHVQRQCKPK